MAELRRYYAVDGDLSRWVVAGPHGAITLETAIGQFVGLFVHSRSDRHNEGAGDAHCYTLDGECWADALGQDAGRRIFALPTDGQIYDRLEAEYRRVWPDGGNCGESVPQAGYDDVPKAGA